MAKHNYSSAFSALAFLSGRVDDSAYYAELRSFSLSNDAETIRVFCERDLMVALSKLPADMSPADLAAASTAAIAVSFRPLERFLAIAGGKKQDAVAKHAAGKKADAATAAPTIPATREGIAAELAAMLTRGATTVATDATTETSDALASGRVVKRERAA